MSNTDRSFLDKWEKNERLAFDETLRENSDINKWILNRNGFQSLSELKRFLVGKERVLDAGCGNGRVTALLRKYSSPEDTEIVGIDLVAAEVAQKNLLGYANVKIFKKNLLEDLEDLGKFDFIYCQEVLHHTADPKKAFSNLCKLLSPRGEIAIYVYKKKAPVREFTDDYVRQKISCLTYEEALAICNQIAAFGKTLAELKLKVNVPAVDILEIKEGEYDLQRLIYHFFMKCFWNDGMSFNDNVVINYDWYHPQLCSKHTVEEVRGWFNHEGLRINHEFVDSYGITIRGARD